MTQDYTEWKDLKDKEAKAQAEYENASYERMQAESQYRELDNEYEFLEKEAAGEWGNDVPPGNTAEHRSDLHKQSLEARDKYNCAAANEQEKKEEWQNCRNERQQYENGVDHHDLDTWNGQYQVDKLEQEQQQEEEYEY